MSASIVNLFSTSQLYIKKRIARTRYLSGSAQDFLATVSPGLLIRAMVLNLGSGTPRGLLCISMGYLTVSLLLNHDSGGDYSQIV